MSLNSRTGALSSLVSQLTTRTNAGESPVRTNHSREIFVVVFFGLVSLLGLNHVVVWKHVVVLHVLVLLVCNDTTIAFGLLVCSEKA